MPPLVCLTLSFIMGILLTRSWMEDATFAWLLLVVLLVLSGGAYYRRLANPTLLLLIGAFILGGFLHAYAAFTPHSGLLSLAGENVVLEGVVVEEPVRREGRTSYRLRVQRLEHEDNVYVPQGIVQLYLYDEKDDQEGFSYQTKSVNEDDPTRGYHYGESIKVESALRKADPPRNPGGFDYRLFQQTQGVDAHMYAQPHQVEYQGMGDLGFFPAAAFTLRSHMMESIENHLPSLHDDLLIAILFGERERLPEDVQENFTRAGVGHLMAVSGLHVGLVAGFALALLRRFRLQSPLWTLAAIVAVVGYAYLTGMRPPALRASLMISLGMTALLWGRERDFPVALSLAALTTLVFNPLLLFSVGFQLSYAATLAIYYLYPLFQREFFYFLPRSLRGLPAVTLAAQVGVLPLVAYHFQEVPLTALIFNLLFLPVMALVVGLGLAGGVFSLLSSFPAMLAHTANLPLLTYLLLFSSLAQAPGVHPEVRPPHLFWIVAFYLLTALAVLGYHRWRAYQEEVLSEEERGSHRVLSLYSIREQFARFPYASGGSRPLAGLEHRFGASGMRVLRRTTFLLILLILVAVIWVVPAFTPSQLEVTFLDVGQGAAVFLETSCGFTALIDAGGDLPMGDTVGAEVGERVILPFLYQRGVRELDLAVITHPHEDHFGGFFPVFQRLPVNTLWISPVPGETDAYRELLEKARQRGMLPEEVRRGETLRPTEELHLKVVAPPAELLRGTNCDLNNNSVVILATYGEVDFLFTGDMEEEAVQELMHSGKSFQPRVLKIPHHGGYFASVEAFLAEAAPDAAAIQVGTNPFGHPHPDITQALEEAHIPYFRNDQHGAVIFRTDGQALHYETMLEKSPF